MRLYPLVKFHLKIAKKQILGWCVSLFAVAFLYMILFPSVQDMAQIKMDAMPKELLQLFGMEELNDMGNFVTYFGMIYNLLLIAISIFTATFTNGIIAKEEQEKTIEFLYALPVNRKELYCSKGIAAFCALIFVVMSVASATILCGCLNGGKTFVLIDVLQIIKFSSITAFVFASVALLLAGLSTKISGGTAGSMVVLVCYTCGFLADILPEEFAWLAYGSPFAQFSPEAILEMGQGTLVAMACYSALMIACAVLGCVRYQQRDFNL